MHSLLPRLINIPEPIGIVDPEREKAITALALVVIEKLLVAASPPPAPIAHPS